MKLNIILIALFVFSFSGCSLDEEAFSSYAPVSFYTSEKNIEAGVIASYHALNRIYNVYDYAMPRMTFLTAPHATTRIVAYLPFSNFTFTSADLQIRNMWRNVYQSINQASYMISLAPQIEMSDAKRDALVAEAKFIRTYNYFNLVRFFGDIPFSLDATTTDANALKEFKTVSEIYEALVSDFNDEVMAALPKVREGTEKGRATQAAAKVLAAKMYLTMAGHPLRNASYLEKAEKLLEDVCDGRAAYGLDLVANYVDIFGVENELNNEVIFALQSNSSIESSGTSISFTNAPLYSLTGGGGQGIWVVREEFYDSFKSDDARKDIFVTSYVDARNGNVITWGKAPYTPAGIKGLIPYKYQDPSATNAVADGSADYIIFRLADAIMMLAEVRNELHGPTEGVGPLNEVLDRAGVPIDPDADENGVPWTKESLREFIFQERFKELCFEFHEFFDIQRFGKMEWAITTSPDCIAKGTTYKPSLEYFPIPETELTARY